MPDTQINFADVDSYLETGKSFFETLERRASELVYSLIPKKLHISSSELLRLCSIMVSAQSSGRQQGKYQANSTEPAWSSTGREPTCNCHSNTNSVESSTDKQDLLFTLSCHFLSHNRDECSDWWKESEFYNPSVFFISFHQSKLSSLL